MNTRRSATLKQMDKQLDLLSPHNASTATTSNFPYFSSPNLTSLENGLLNGLNDIDVSTNGLNRFVSNTKASVVVNKSCNNLNSDEIVSTNVTKKYVTINSAKDEELKAKEDYLNHLKSIDMTKYSYPNEFKPPTDYTYARSSSYLSNQNDDNWEMPNLRRRSRISPSSSLNLSGSSRVTKNEKSFKIDEKIDNAIQNTKTRLTFYQKIKLYFDKNGKQQTSTNNIVAPIASTQLAKDDFVFKKPSIPINTSGVRLNRNIGNEFDDHEQSIYSSKSTTTSSNRPEQKIGGSQKKTRNFFSIFFVLLLSAPFILFALSRIESDKSLVFDQSLPRDFYSFVKDDLVNPSYSYVKQFSYNVAHESSNAWSEYSPWLKDNFYNLYLWSREFSFSFIRMVIYYADYAYEITKDVFMNLFSYLKEYYNYYMSSKSNLTNYVNNANVDYKLSNQMNVEQNEQILNDINELKEKIFSEAMQNLNNYKTNHKLVDIDLMRKELDQKFNYTLNLMSNKLVDQAMQIENSKTAHEKEIEKMKNVLHEIEVRYTFTLNQLQDQLLRQKQAFDEQQKLQKQQLSKENSVDNPLKMSLASNEYISFEKIEEYINKTFYVYNADKTGMTDFASESVGGSILFTRCTEAYQDNSRWFTIFDVPITRVTVSPRVVIQGSIQPGNCWSFKGSKGDLFIKLAAKITPKSFSLEHIPKELSLTGNIDSAPQNFTVYGYVNKDDISDDNRILLGNYRYDNNSKNTLQFFDVQNECKDKPIAVIELKIESNAGNKDYTCLYKFRVHGKLFEKNNQISSQNTINDIN